MKRFFTSSPMVAIMVTMVCAYMGLALAGCDTVPVEPQYALCKVPVMRNAGMGVQVKDCAYWEFGPTKQQQAQFNKRSQ